MEQGWRLKEEVEVYKRYCWDDDLTLEDTYRFQEIREKLLNKIGRVEGADAPCREDL